MSLVISQDDHIAVIFFPGFHLATGKKAYSYKIYLELVANLLSSL